MIEYSNGSFVWSLNNKQHSFKEWLKLTPVSDEEKILLRLKYGN